MRRLRTNKSLVLFSVAVVVIAGLFPVVAAGLPSVILTPLWLIAPAVCIVVVRRRAARCDDQPSPSSRSPPPRASGHVRSRLAKGRIRGS